MNVNHLLVTILLVMSAVDVVIAYAVLPKLLARNRKATTESRAMVIRAVYAAAAGTTALAGYFYFFNPLETK